MPDLKPFKKIICPDFGEIRINAFELFDATKDLISAPPDVSESYGDLIKTILKANAAESFVLTDRDIECITLELAKIYKVEQIYTNLTKSVSRPEALRGALKESPYLKEMQASLAQVHKTFSDAIASTKLVQGIFQEPFRSVEASIKKASEPLSLLRDISISNRMHYPFRDIASYLANINQLSEYVSKNSIDIKRTFADAVSSVYVSNRTDSLFKEIANQLSFRTNAIAETVKTTSEFHQNIKRWSDSVSDIFRDKWIERDRLQLANATVSSSEKIINQTNDYFTLWWKLPEIPRKIRLPDELIDKKNELENSNTRSERILEIEGDAAILTTNNIAYKLHGEITELRKDIKLLGEYKSLDERLKKLDAPGSFIEHLREFAIEIAKSYWEIFWIKKGVKFVPNPERLAKSHLGMFLRGKFSGVAFVGRELRSGNGFIDTYVHIFGKAYIVEIKIVGSTWSFSDAEAGISQLDKYMQSEGQSESYLVVFDGRKTERGKKLTEYVDVEHGRVWTVTSRIYWASPS